MNKYLSLHDTIQDRQDNVLDYTNTPHISYTEEDNKIVYTKYQSKITATYQINNIGNTYVLGNHNESIYYHGIEDGDVIRMVVNGVDVEPSLTYNFLETGEHIIEFYFGKNITSCRALFAGVTSLVFVDISKFNSSELIDAGMAFAAPNGNGNLKYIIGLHNFVTNKCMYIESLFYGQGLIEELDVSNWDVSSIEKINSIFCRCTKLKNIKGDLSKWNTSNVILAYNIFNQCNNLEHIGDLSKWNTSKMTTMKGMFASCSKVKSIGNVSEWNTSNVTDMSNMFNLCSELESVPGMSNWDVSNVTTFLLFMSDCNSLKYVDDLSKWNAPKCTSCKFMFGMSGNNNNYTLEQLDISNLLVNNNVCTNVSCMFLNCRTLKSIGDISKWNVSNISDFTYMFTNCMRLNMNSLGDLTKWNTTKMQNIHNMFAGSDPYNYGAFRCFSIPKSCTTSGAFLYKKTYNIVKCGKISSSISFEWAEFSRESALVLINALDPDNNGTLKLSTYTKNLLSTEDVEIATNKGWTIA